MTQTADWLDAVAWDDNGLVPAIAQDGRTGRVLMQAWMNRQALAATVATGYATYWSRSRRTLWVKGETSGHRQLLRELRLDCDHDALLLSVEQVGDIACHTGRESCFYQRLAADDWEVVEPVRRRPEEIYG